MNVWAAATAPQQQQQQQQQQHKQGTYSTADILLHDWAGCTWELTQHKEMHPG